MTIPAVGLFLIVVFYYVRLWQIRQSAVVVDFLDTEMGPLQKQDKSLEDTDAVAVRSNRDLCVWLAIGWLFMVKEFVCSVIVVLLLTFRPACTQVYTILCRTTFQSFACKDIVSTLPIAITGTFTCKTLSKQTPELSRTRANHTIRTISPSTATPLGTRPTPSSQASSLCSTRSASSHSSSHCST